MVDEPSESPTEPVNPAAPEPPATPPPTPEPPTAPTTPASSTAPPPAPTPPLLSAAPPASPPPPASIAPPASAAAPPPQPPHGGERRQPPPLPQLITELRDLVVTYVKQQTIAPIKSLGRYVGFGLLGSLLLGFGVVFLGVGGLRLLQTETGDTFSGDWSWVPYLIMVFVLALGAALVWLLRTATTAKQEAR